jgi:hypothetical protein
MTAQASNSKPVCTAKNIKRKDVEIIPLEEQTGDEKREWKQESPEQKNKENSLEL